MKKRGTRILLPAVCACLFISSSLAFALTPEDKKYLSLYFSDEELVVQSATRNQELISRVAENMTVVTAADIERMNAHTLADVLNTVPGVEVWLLGGPGQQAQATILGSNDRHVTVIMDGVVMNNLWSGIQDLGIIPVQNIEKIEIIKGPASSAWGSALGGVVNIITKSGRVIDQGGIVSGSVGPKGFGDFRVEGRGKQDRLGYYLTAGRLQSDGLTPHLSASAYNAYTKLSFDLTEKTDALFTIAYSRTLRDDFYNNYSPDPTFALSMNDRSEYLHSTVGVNSALSKNLDFNISLWAVNQYMNSGSTDLATGGTTYDKDLNKGYGASAKLVWKTGQQTVVLGTDLSNMTDKIYVLPKGEQSISKWAVYANDTLTLNSLTMIPGIRFDRTSSNGDITSPSLGLTYGIGNSTILRAYAARGFGVPKTGDTFGYLNGWVGNPDLRMETVRSYQAGVETAAFNYFWMKLSVFRNEIRDLLQSVVLPNNDIQFQNIGRERREGVLFEARTKPVYHVSVSTGVELNTAKDLTTGETAAGVPVQLYDIAVRYDDQESFKAQLLGRHINWNATPDYMSKYHSLLVDLNMIKKIRQEKAAILEVFLNGHNLLNTTQYLTVFFPNPERWFEAGLRYKF